MGRNGRECDAAISRDRTSRAAMFVSMHVPLGPRFQEERDRFAFLFSCEDCVYFDARRPGCAHGYPTAPHRAAAFAPDDNAGAMFCKEFEIV